MIVVTGATGKLGGLVVERLLERVPADQVAVTARDPKALDALGARGIEVRRGDADDAESLVRAFDGASRVLLVSVPRWGDEAVAAARRMIEAAKRAAVGRILYTSHAGADLLSAFVPAVGHARTEGHLLESGVPFTSLRNGFYADTPVQWVRQAISTGELRLPEDGPVSWTTREDLAAATAALLADDALDVPTVNLTAAEAVDADRLAVIAAVVSGRPVRRIVVTDEEHRRSLVGAGVPEFGAQAALSIVVASRQRHLAVVDPALERLVGRPATPLMEVLRGAVA